MKRIMNMQNLGVGGNNPPSAIEFAESFLFGDFNDFMSDTPVIETEEQARATKSLLDRAKLALEAVEQDRDSKVRPLNDQVKSINEKYKALHNTDAKKPGTLDKIVAELKNRFQGFMTREEDRRSREAEAARVAQAEAERKAREAEARELEAKANAASGEVVDVAAVTAEADTAFEGYQQASRFADLAQRDSRVAIGGGFGRTATLRTVETPQVESYSKAIKAIGKHEKIEEGILAAAREYKRTYGAWPDGITVTQERKL